MTDTQKIMALPLALAVALSATACTRELPDRTQQNQQAEAAQVTAPASDSTHIVVNVSSDKTLPPDIANITLEFPAKSADEKTPVATEDDIRGMLVDQGAAEDAIQVTSTDETITAQASNLAIRDAARAQREAEAMGGKLASIAYDVSDPSSIKKEAITEALGKAYEEGDVMAAALQDGYKVDNQPVSVEQTTIETIAQTESEVTVRVGIRVTFNMVPGKSGE